MNAVHHLDAYRADTVRRSAAADAYRLGEPVLIVWRPQEVPTVTGGTEPPGPYWLPAGLASAAQKNAGEVVHPADPAGLERQAGVLGEVVRERARQDRLFGGPDHDDTHSSSKWIALVIRHLGLAVDDGAPDGVCYVDDGLAGTDPARWRKQMVRVAAIACAAVEAFDRKLARIAAAAAAEEVP